ncbi:MAG: hypothetical protein ACR2IE_14345 [Candidatus Sumerlaeaceae bacterium]
MNSAKLIILAAACITGVGAILGYAWSRGRQAVPHAPRVTQSSQQNPATVVTPLQPQRQPQTAATHVNALRNTVRLAEANMNVGRMARPETTAAEHARLEAETLEQKLVDSMARLTEQLSKDPGSVKDAIALLEAESDPALMTLLAQAIGQAADAMGDKFPYDSLLKMALNDPSQDKRRAALTALGYMSKIPTELQQQVAEISRNAPSNELRIAAVECLGAWMSKNPALKQTISETLLATRVANEDAAVRGIAIQTIGNQDTPLSRKVFEAMADAVVHEVAPHNRSLAALALGGGVGPENREAILSTLEAAYLGEANLDTQRHLITQIAKAARYDAEDYLGRLPTPHPLLAQDIKDYVEILASADRKDWGAIWDQKSNRDHERGTYPGSHGGHDTDDH